MQTKNWQHLMLHINEVFVNSLVNVIVNNDMGTHTAKALCEF